MSTRLPFALLVAFALAAMRLEAQPATLFTLHSNPWINLHVFARAAARGVPVQADLSEQERAVWVAGVEPYKPYASRDLLFDQELVDIKWALHTAEGKANLEGVAIDSRLRATLERLMPIYQKHVEYSARANLYTPMCGAGCREKIIEHWTPRLDGNRSVDEGLSALVASFK